MHLFRRTPRPVQIMAILLIAFSFAPFGPLTHAQGVAHTFPETGHTAQGAFWQYWQSHGGLAQQGYPFSAEIQERADLNGQTYSVQYFERAVFEQHPENAPPYDVLLSQVGTYRYQARYGALVGTVDDLTGVADIAWRVTREPSTRTYTDGSPAENPPPILGDEAPVPRQRRRAG